MDKEESFSRLVLIEGLLCKLLPVKRIKQLLGSPFNSLSSKELVDLHSGQRRAG